MVGELVEPRVVSLSNHVCMMVQTLKQVQGDKFGGDGNFWALISMSLFPDIKCC